MDALPIAVEIGHLARPAGVEPLRERLRASGILSLKESGEYYGFGLALDTFGLKVEHEGESTIPGVDEKGSVEFGYRGVGLYVRGLF